MRINKKSQQRQIPELLNTQKQYLSCKKCRFIFNIYSGSLHDTKYMINKPQMDHFINNRQQESIKITTMKWEVGKNQLLCLPPSQIMNTRIIGKEGKWMLQCEGCQAIVGIIDSSEVLFIKDNVEIQTVRYQVLSNNVKDLDEKEYETSNKEMRLQNLQRVERQVQRYIQLALKLIEQKMGLIQTKRLQKSQQQFHNFIKFYQKWKTHHNSSSLGRQHSTVLSIAR